MTHVFRYSVPVEVTVRVEAADDLDDLDGVNRAEIVADDLAREALSRLALNDGPVLVNAPVDLPNAYEITHEN